MRREGNAYDVTDSLDWQTSLITSSPMRREVEPLLIMYGRLYRYVCLLFYMLTNYSNKVDTSEPF